jgi:hypothetical protein
MSRPRVGSVVRCAYAPECTHTSTCRGCDGDDPTCDCADWICKECIRAEARADDAFLGTVGTAVTVTLRGEL